MVTEEQLDEDTLGDPELEGDTDNSADQLADGLVD